MKLAIYTSALEGWISGGIACIVHVLNHMRASGHDVCAFVDINADKDCSWIKNEFPIYPVDSEEFRNYDGILVSPFSPTAKAVADHENAQDRFYWVHTNEAVFNDNDLEWRQRAKDSYSLPLKMFCTSSYVQIIMEQIYNRNVIPQLVSPGFDPDIFSRDSLGGDRRRDSLKSELRVVMWGRGGWVRGTDVALAGIQRARDLGLNIKTDVMQDGIRSPVAVAQRYSNAHVYLDASRLAGCPTPVIEAMACGTVPICTHYGTTDFVHKHNGYVVAPDDPDGIALALQMVNARGWEEWSYQSHQATDDVANKAWKNISEAFEVAVKMGLNQGKYLEPRFS